MSRLTKSIAEEAKTKPYGDFLPKSTLLTQVVEPF